METLRMISFFSALAMVATWTVIQLVKPELLKRMGKLLTIMMIAIIACVSFITFSYGNIWAGVLITAVGFGSMYFMGKLKK